MLSLFLDLLVLRGVRLDSGFSVLCSLCRDAFPTWSPAVAHPVPYRYRPFLGWRVLRVPRHLVLTGEESQYHVRGPSGCAADYKLYPWISRSLKEYDSLCQSCVKSCNVDA